MYDRKKIRSAQNVRDVSFFVVPSLCENTDEDLKVIDVTPIEYLFSNVNLDKDGTIDESTFVKRRPNYSEF